MRLLNSLLHDNKGIFWQITVGTIVIMIATLTWLVIMLVMNSFITIFDQTATSTYAIQFGETEKIQGSIVIVIIDVGMIVWMFVSAFRKESQEMPL